jgi:hypothetical protein
MKIIWQIEADDVVRVQTFIEKHKNSPLVTQRVEHNLRENKPEVTKSEFWQVMIACLLTTQQRSGPKSAVTRFLNIRPFPLEYTSCLSQADIGHFVKETITEFGGIRRTNKIADEVEINLTKLKNGLWKKTFVLLDRLRDIQTIKLEREAAYFVDNNFKGFGPKQSRNLLQSLGLTKYEIPIDSRITKWLNQVGFPVKLTAGALADRHYYDFVSEGFQKLCAACDIYPCVLDAIIFSSFDGDGWTEENVVW